MRKDENPPGGEIRNFWLRAFLLGAPAAVICYKVAISDLSGLLTGFSFTDLLALFLSIFSVWFSVSFYHKATDSSNEFYNNSYNFAKEISVILGRIEAGFGEQLKHINEGYTQLNSRFPREFQKANEKVHQDEVEVKEKEDERDALISSLLEKVDADEEEKARMRAQLQASENEVVRARDELAVAKAERKKLHQKLEVIDANKVLSDPWAALPSEINNEVTQILKLRKFDQRIRKMGLFSEVQAAANEMVHYFPPHLKLALVT